MGGSRGVGPEHGASEGRGEGLVRLRDREAVLCAAGGASGGGVSGKSDVMGA